MDWLPTSFQYLSRGSRVNLEDLPQSRCGFCGSLKKYAGYCTKCTNYGSEENASYEEVCAILIHRKEPFYELRFTEIDGTKLKIDCKSSIRTRMLVMVFDDESGERQSRLGGYRFTPYTVAIDDDAPDDDELVGIGIPLDLEENGDHPIFPVREGLMDDTYILADKTRPLARVTAIDHGVFEGYVVSSSESSQNKEVAVKIDRRFRDQNSHKVRGMRTFDEMKEEFSLVQKAGSPYVVKYCSLALDDPKTKGAPCTAYLAMELCQRKTLSDVMRGLTPSQIRVTAMQLLLGLSHLHSNDILHRDLTPENVFISKSGKRIKIGDFDHVKELEQGMSHVSNSSRSRSMELKKHFEFHTHLKTWKEEQIRKGKHHQLRDLRSRYRASDDVFSAAVIICACFFKNQDCINKWERRRQGMKGIPVLGMDLIESVIEQKYSAEDALTHPYFWDYNKRFEFFEQLKKYFLPFVKNIAQPDSDIERKLFDDVRENLRFDWISEVLDKTLRGPEKVGVLKAAKESRWNYDRKDIFDFIRFVRNTKTHHDENRETKGLFNSNENLWTFFETSPQFSEVFLRLWKTVKISWVELAECSEFPSDFEYFFTSGTTPLLDLPKE